MNVPIVELRSQYLALREEIDRAMREVLEASWFVLGRQGPRFEEAFAAYLETSHVAGVGSGTEALHLALLAVGVGAGDEVITTPLTAAATACAIRFAGATPVFADVDPKTLTLDPREVERKRTARTRAILPVHLYGHAADMDPLRSLAGQYGLRIVEDCAQAHGTRYRGRQAGTLGDAGAFSFYPSKNLGAYGDGGAVACADPAIDARLRMLRNYGEARRYEHMVVGYNSRLDEIQAAILRVKLPHLEGWNERRRAIAAVYHEQIRHPEIALPVEQPWSRHIYHLYVVRASRRDALRRHLADRGVGSQIHYPIPLHLQPAFTDLGQKAGSCPVAERAAGEILSIPIYPEMADEQTAHVVDAINAF